MKCWGGVWLRSGGERSGRGETSRKGAKTQSMRGNQIEAGLGVLAREAGESHAERVVAKARRRKGFGKELRGRKTVDGGCVCAAVLCGRCWEKPYCRVHELINAVACETLREEFFDGITGYPGIGRRRGWRSSHEQMGRW